MICDIVWMSLQSHFSFDTYCSDPVLSGNCSVMTSGVEEDGNRELGLWDRLPVRS